VWQYIQCLRCVTGCKIGMKRVASYRRKQPAVKAEVSNMAAVEVVRLAFRGSHHTKGPAAVLPGPRGGPYS
jgi:hypothetical protein